MACDKNGRRIEPGEPQAAKAERIADLEAAIAAALRHSEANGMKDWPVFRRLRKALNRCGG